MIAETLSTFSVLCILTLNEETKHVDIHKIVGKSRNVTSMKSLTLILKKNKVHVFLLLVHQSNCFSNFISHTTETRIWEYVI